MSKFDQNASKMARLLTTLDVLPYVGDGQDAVTVCLARQSVLQAISDNASSIGHLGVCLWNGYLAKSHMPEVVW